MIGFLTQTGWAGHSRVAFRWTLKAPSGGSPVWLAPLFVMERSLVGSFFRQKTTRNVFQTQNELKRYLIALIGILTNFLLLPLLWVYITKISYILSLWIKCEQCVTFSNLYYGCSSCFSCISWTMGHRLLIDMFPNISEFSQFYKTF